MINGYSIPTASRRQGGFQLLVARAAATSRPSRGRYQHLPVMVTQAKPTLPLPRHLNLPCPQCNQLSLSFLVQLQLGLGLGLGLELVRQTPKNCFRKQIHPYRLLCRDRVSYHLKIRLHKHHLWKTHIPRSLQRYVSRSRGADPASRIPRIQRKH
jgi:hypothetical protein